MEDQGDIVFFFSSRRRHTRWPRDWSSDVCSSDLFLTEKDVVAEPKGVYNLKGDTARIEFVNRFKEVQRLKTQLDQYTDLDEEQKARINNVLPEDDLRSLRGAYLETAQRLKEQQGKTGEQASPDQEAIEQLDFEFVLFSSALIDYDYIMGLIARFSQ